MGRPSATHLILLALQGPYVFLKLAHSLTHSPTIPSPTRQAFIALHHWQTPHHTPGGSLAFQGPDHTDHHTITHHPPLPLSLPPPPAGPFPFPLSNSRTEPHNSKCQPAKNDHRLPTLLPSHLPRRRRHANDRAVPLPRSQRPRRRQHGGQPGQQQQHHHHHQQTGQRKDRRRRRQARAC